MSSGLRIMSVILLTVMLILTYNAFTDVGKPDIQAGLGFLAVLSGLFGGISWGWANYEKQSEVYEKMRQERMRNLLDSLSR